MSIFLKIRDIGISKNKSDDFVLTTISIYSIDKKNREIYAYISCKIHLVNRLKTNILVGSNLFDIEGFAINLSTSLALIHSYDVKIDINTRHYSKFLKYRVLASTITIVPLCLQVLITFQHIKLPDSCNFSFYSSFQQHLILYYNLLNYTSAKVCVHNNVDHTIKIPLHHRLGCVTKPPYKNYFVTSADFDVVSTPPILLTIFHDRNGISILPAGNLQKDLPNGITIYKDKEAIDAITYLVDEYPLIWESSGFIQIPPKCQIKVHL